MKMVQRRKRYKVRGKICVQTKKPINTETKFDDNFG